MELSGKTLAAGVLDRVRERILRLGEKKIIPELAIVTVGGEEAWFSYVSQKLKTAERLGIKTQRHHIDATDENSLFKLCSQLNNDKAVHGVIVQRPLPAVINRKKIVDAIEKNKDIDGFREDSPYAVPMVLAIEHFIREAYGVITASDLEKVLINQSICVVGKGETAGKPATKYLDSKRAAYTIIDTKTKNPCQELKKADLVITGVGKSDVIKPECLKPGVVLIGIGIHAENGKLVGDYDVAKIKGIAKAWTPTPGGVGPLNLAYLFQNLVDATEKLTSSK
ncbi:MAG: tetrahydrofolate dehydrogenase/cyclohydrolase catalytic domain-containing protein [Candidatus Levyibacteriota bacterium]